MCLAWGVLPRNSNKYSALRTSSDYFLAKMRSLEMKKNITANDRGHTRRAFFLDLQDD
jgi:hypothetical protein